MSGDDVIVDLIDCPQHVPVIAQWMWDEWDHRRAWTLQQSIDECASWLNRDRLPLGLLALRKDKPVGVICLHPRDLEERPDLLPWMACQYVVPHARGGQVAMALSRALEARAKQLNFRRLYMWTEHNAAIYRRYGYAPLFMAQFCGQPITVMGKDL